MPPKPTHYTALTPAVRVTPAIRSKLERAADRMGLSLTDYIRVALAMALEFPRLVRQTRREGMNSGQPG